MKESVSWIRKLAGGIPCFSAVGLAAFAFAWCVALWLARKAESGSGDYFYLIYNLGLALVPLGISSTAARFPFSRRTIWIWAIWLAFFPNAPYLITDLIHLRPRPEAPFWFDWLMFVSFSGTGFLIGVVSLSQVHQRLRMRFPFRIADGIVAGILGLTAFGLYLGRFPRWNSWDIISRPDAFFGHVAELLLQPWNHPRMVAYSFGVAVILGLGYFGPLLIFRALPTVEKGPVPDRQD